MNVIITPSRLCGKVAAVPSKSETHRMIICAAVADKPTEIQLDALSDDIKATLGCVEAMGASVDVNEASLTVTPIHKKADRPCLDCGESGSTLRFLLPLCAALCLNATFVGGGKLPLRPLDDLTAALRCHGVDFDSPKLPLSISGRLSGGEYLLPGNVSSQYITGLLLSLPLLDCDSTLTLSTPLQSAAYVDITLDIMRRYCVHATFDGTRFTVGGGQRYVSPEKISVGGDWSNAAFFLTAASLGGQITVTALDGFSKQVDKKITDILRLYGAEVLVENNAVTVAQKARKPLAVDKSLTADKSLAVDVSQIPDLFPILTVAAAYLVGETSVFTGISRLRDKESDRVKSCAEMLYALGIKTDIRDGAFYVTGGIPHGGTVDAQGDHRIAMAAAVAASLAEGEVEIVGAEAVNKSYPSFFDDYIKLGGKVRVK